jgi:hypothetical protein
MKHRKPRNTEDTLTEYVRELARKLTGDYLDNLYVTDTNTGRVKFKNWKVTTITIPLWAHLDDREGYEVYYLAHELAHAYGDGWQHNATFYKWFDLICPEEYQHYELEYKPRAAKAAGISMPT